MDRALAPVEYLVVGFPGSDLDGRIVPALADLVDRDVIRIIDLVFVRRTREGRVEAVELADLGEAAAAAFASLAMQVHTMANAEDLDLVAEALAPGDSAALLVWEDLWAGRLAEALRGSGAEILAHERVPHDIAMAAATAVGTGG